MSNKVTSADNQQGRLNEKLTPEYIVGLVDGEGYFSVTARMEHYKTYSCHRIRLVFGMDLNTIDGKILYNLCDWFGCGKVRLRKDDRKNFSDQLQYQVRDMKSVIEVIIPFFQKHPLRLLKRKKTFSKFVEIAKMIEKNIHRTQDGFEKIVILAHNLHSY